MWLTVLMSYSANNLGVGRIIVENLTAIDCGRMPFM